jgi:hypothetical protein
VKFSNFKLILLLIFFLYFGNDLIFDLADILKGTQNWILPRADIDGSPCIIDKPWVLCIYAYCSPKADEDNGQKMFFGGILFCNYFKKAGLARLSTLGRS